MIMVKRVVLVSQKGFNGNENGMAIWRPNISPTPNILHVLMQAKHIANVLVHKFIKIGQNLINVKKS
jgi:hypothetical protein